MMNLLAIDWNVDPNIFTIGDFEVRWYGLLFAASFFVGYQIMQRIFKREGVSLKVLDKLLLYVLIATVVGARLGHVLFYEPSEYFADPIRILNIREGGLASHGATITIIFALWIFSKRLLKDKPVLWVFDRSALSIAIACFFIRMGNLFNHEIMGTKTDMPWGFRFSLWQEPGSSPFNPIEPAVRHPAQLYEALAYLLIAGLIWFLFFKKRKGQQIGFITGLFLTLLFAARFLIEFVKEGQAEFEWLADIGLTMGQLLSIPCVIVGIIIMVRSKNKPYEEQLAVEGATPESESPKEEGS